MFETLSINTEKVSVERLLDALCFFQRVRFCGNPARLAELIGRLEPENTKRLVESGNIALVADRYRQVVIQANPEIPIFDSGTISVAGTADGRKVRSAKDELEIAYERRFGRRDAFLPFFQSNLIEMPNMEQVLVQGRLDFLDRNYMQRVVKDLLSVWAPEYAVPTLDITATQLDDGQLAFSAPIDYDAINRFVRTHFTAHDLTVTPALILAHVLDTRKEILANIEGKSDIWFDSAHEKCFRTRVVTSIERATGGEQIGLFNDVILNRTSIGSAVSSGNRTISEAVDLLQDSKTQSFRQWLVSRSPEANIVEEYYKDTFSSPKWQSGVRFKVAKISVLTGVGAVLDAALGGAGAVGAALGAGAGAAMSAVDEFILQRIRLGWTPAHWVEDVARPFSHVDDGF